MMSSPPKSIERTESRTSLAEPQLRPMLSHEPEHTGFDQNFL